MKRRKLFLRFAPMHQITLSNLDWRNCCWWFWHLSRWLSLERARTSRLLIMTDESLTSVTSQNKLTDFLHTSNEMEKRKNRTNILWLFKRVKNIIKLCSNKFSLYFFQRLTSFSLEFNAYFWPPKLKQNKLMDTN
jgi:hypothetical protein